MIRVIYFSFLLLFGCQSADQTTSVIDSDELQKLMSEGVAIVDIRTFKEYRSGHIQGVKHIDFYEEGFVDKMIAGNPSKVVAIHCASGGRSGKATKLLLDAGFEKVYDYSGGFRDWNSKGLPVEK